MKPFLTSDKSATIPSRAVANGVGTSAIARPTVVPAQRANRSKPTLDGQTPVQLFSDYSSWKGAREGAPKEEKELIKDYMREMVAGFRQVFSTIEGAAMTEATRANHIRNVNLQALYKKIIKIQKDIKEGADIDVAELNIAAGYLTDLEGAAPLIESRRSMNPSAMGGLTEELFRLILSFTPITGLIGLHGVNRYLRHLVDTTLVFRMELPNMGSAVLNVTFHDVTNYMKGFRFGGLHGSSDADKHSLYGGLKERKEEKDKVYPTSQLGPGFYLTDGNGPGDKVYAESVAKERAKMTKTSAVVFRVLLNTQSVERVEVPRENWADMAREKTPPALTELSKTPRLLTAPVVENEHVSQIKVNSPLFKLVRILPPSDKMDAEFYNWIRALCEQSPFDIGSIDY